MTTFCAKMEAARIDLLRYDGEVPSRNHRDQRRKLITFYDIAINAPGRIDLRTGQLEQPGRRRSLVR
jgi:hypothetical protein